MPPTRFAAAAAIALAACSNAQPAPDVSTVDASNTHDAAVADMSTVTDSSASESDPGTVPNRDFTLHARDMTGFQGRAMNVWVVDATGSNEIAYGMQAAVSDVEFEFRMPDLIPAGDYRVDVFIDANGNGRYDGAAIDPSWRIPIPNDGSALVAMHGTDPTSDIRAMMAIPRHDVTIALSGFTANEQGQRLELRVIDQSTRQTVGAYVLPQLSTANLSFTLSGIVDDGSSYNVDFWSDVDASGTYSGLGADHTWRVPVTASATGAHVQWAHSDAYVELDWR